MPTSSRRRRPFIRTTSEDGDDDSPAELDEEHQEALITSLATADERKTNLYRQIFVAISLLATLPFLWTVVSVSSGAGPRERGLAVMCASSIACSAWVLWFIPIEEPRPETWAGLGKGKDRSAASMRREERGPLETYLPWMNGALAGLLFGVGLLAMGKQGRGGRAEEEAWRLTLPGIMFVLNIFVRQQLVPLNLEDLQRARYEYKGA